MTSLPLTTLKIQPYQPIPTTIKVAKSEINEVLEDFAQKYAVSWISLKRYDAPEEAVNAKRKHIILHLIGARPSSAIELAKKKRTKPRNWWKVGSNQTHSKS